MSGTMPLRMPFLYFLLFSSHTLIHAASLLETSIYGAVKMVPRTGFSELDAGPDGPGYRPRQYTVHKPPTIASSPIKHQKVGNYPQPESTGDSGPAFFSRYDQELSSIIRKTPDLPLRRSNYKFREQGQPADMVHHGVVWNNSLNSESHNKQELRHYEEKFLYQDQEGNDNSLTRRLPDRQVGVAPHRTRQQLERTTLIQPLLHATYNEAKGQGQLSSQTNLHRRSVQAIRNHFNQLSKRGKTRRAKGKTQTLPNGVQEKLEFNIGVQRTKEKQRAVNMEEKRKQIADHMPSEQSIALVGGPESREEIEKHKQLIEKKNELQEDLLKEEEAKGKEKEKKEAKKGKQQKSRQQKPKSSTQQHETQDLKIQQGQESVQRQQQQRKVNEQRSPETRRGPIGSYLYAATQTVASQPVQEENWLTVTGKGKGKKKGG